MTGGVCLVEILLGKIQVSRSVLSGVFIYIVSQNRIAFRVGMLHTDCHVFCN